jgi:hypothetical protein
MKRAARVRGTLRDPRHIELDEPLDEMCGPVEVTVRAASSKSAPPRFESATRQEWEQEFHAWVQAHDRNVPIPSPASLRREALYEDRW